MKLRRKQINMKKILPTIVTGALLLSMAVPAMAAETANNPFSDISGSFAKDAIIQLQKEGILTGMDIEHFDPKGSLTRAQFIVIMVKSLKLPIDNNAVSSFTDVEGWAVPYIEAAKKYGIIDGISDTTFAPNATLTREQSAVIMVKALQKQGKIEDSAELTIPDADSVSDWAKKYVALAFKYKLVTGNEDGSFNPQGTATREQAAQMGSNFIQSAEQVKKDNPETKPEPTPTVTPAPTTTPAPVVTGGGGGGGGGGNSTTASSIAISAADISNAVAGTQFDLNVKAKGTVGTDHFADKVRYYVSIAGLTSHDIAVSGVSTVVIQEGTETLPLILGVGESAGFTLGSLTSQYAAGITTTYPVTINKVGSYTFNYSLKTVETNSVTISTGASTVAVAAVETNNTLISVVTSGVSITNLSQSETLVYGDSFIGGIKTTVTSLDLPDSVKDFKYFAVRGSSNKRENLRVEDVRLSENESTVEHGEIVSSSIWMISVHSYGQAWRQVIFYDEDKNPIGYYQESPEFNFNPAKLYDIKLLEGRTIVDEDFIKDVSAARTLYDSLSPEQQMLVTNYEALTVAEALINAPAVDPTVANVTTPDELTVALADTTIKTINVTGTLGSVDAYGIYNVDRPVVINGVNTGSAKATIYGSILISVDGATVNNLSINNKGLRHPDKNAINVLGKQVTITNNDITIGNGSAEGGVANGVVVWAHGDNAVNLNISGNTFTGYALSVPDWSSSALLIVEDIAAAPFAGTPMATTIDIPNEEELISGNIYVGNTYDYSHQNWTNNESFIKLSKVTGLANLNNALESASNGSTVLVSEDITLGSDDMFTVGSGVTLKLLNDATITNGGTIQNNGTIIGSVEGSAPIVGGGTGTPTPPIPTSLTITALDTNAIANQNFTFPVTMKGIIGNDFAATANVRLYATIDGLTSSDIDVKELAGLGKPEVVSLGTEPLKFAWGPTAGFPLSMNKADYESTNGALTPFPVVISKVGNYHVHITLVTIDGIEITHSDANISIASEVVATNLHITANHVDAITNTQFTLPVTTQGVVGNDYVKSKFRFIASIKGLTAADVDFQVIPNAGSPAVVSNGDGANDPLILAWGSDAGFSLEDHKAMYGETNGLTTYFPVTIKKAGNYTVNYSLNKVSATDIVANGESTITVSDQ
jgi:hypothetical protein